MQICNSKAFYLKNYGLHKRTKSHTNKTLPTPTQLNQVIRIRKINRPHYISHTPQESYAEHIALVPKDLRSTSLPHSKEKTNIFEKERDILKKVVDRKVSQTRQKRSKTVSNDYVVVQRHPLGDVTSLEVEVMKPTQRYFYHMTNLRMAEKLLLANPTPNISNKSQKKFYKQQTEYKTNISKLLNRTKKDNELSRLKMLNRKKWLD